MIKTVALKIREEAARVLQSEFGRHLRLSIFGMGTWSVASFLLNVIGGRWIGPQEYGRYGYVMSLASIVAIPMLWGQNTAMIRYAAGKDGESRDKVATTALVGLIIFAAVISILLSGVPENLWSRIVSQEELRWWVIFYAILMTLQLTTDAVYRSFHAFVSQAIWFIVSAVTLVGSLGAAILWAPNSFETIILCVAIGYGTLAIGSMLVFFRNTHARRFESATWKKILYYGFYAMMGGVVGTALISVDRILINHFIGTKELGLYVAYATASTVIMMKFMEVFINVFFPRIIRASAGDKSEIFRQLISASQKFFLPLVLLTMLTTFVTLLFYGKDYEFRTDLFLLFSFQAPLLAIGSIIAWFVNSLGVQWIRHFLWVGFGMVAVNIVLNVILIPKIGLPGAVIALIVVYVLYYVYARYQLSRAFLRQENLHDGLDS